MVTHHSDTQLVGETVTVNYVDNPTMGYGQFSLENRRTVAVTAAVEEAWLEYGGSRKPLVDITVFDRDQERTVDPDSFKVDAEATMMFLIGFPKVDYLPRFGESITVGLRLSVNGTEAQALSPIKFVRRIPSGH